MICPGCGEPVEPGEMRYAGRMPEEDWHAHCWADKRPPATNFSDLRAGMATCIQNAERAMNDLRRALRKIPDIDRLDE